METLRQAWWHDFQLGLALGLFFGSFVIGVRWFEWTWLRQLGLTDVPTMTVRTMTEIMLIWGVVVPLGITLVVAAGRSIVRDWRRHSSA